MSIPSTSTNAQYNFLNLYQRKEIGPLEVIENILDLSFKACKSPLEFYLSITSSPQPEIREKLEKMDKGEALFKLLPTLSVDKIAKIFRASNLYVP